MAVTYQGGDIALNYAPLRQDALNQRKAAQLQEQQARKAQENSAKQAADIVAKINPNGLRDADIPEFSKKYEQFRNAAISVANAGSIQERAKASAELQNQLTDLQIYINSSKNQASTLKDFGTRLSTNPQRARTEQFSRFDQVTKTPTSQLQNVDLNNEFKLGARPEIWTNQVKSVFDEVQQEVRNAKPEMVSLGVMNQNGRTIKQYQYLANIPAETAKLKLQQRYESNSEAKEVADEEASKLGLTVPQYFDRIVDQNKGSLTWRSTPQTVDLTPRKVSGGSSSDNPTSYGTPTVREFLGQPEGTSNIRRFISPQFIPYNGGTISTPQLKSIFNITTGKTEPTVSLKNAEVTGIGYFPRVVNGKNVVGKGISVSAQSPNSEVMEYFISEEKIPHDFKSKDSYGAVGKALGSFKGTPTNTNKTTPKATPNKKTTRGELD